MDWNFLGISNDEIEKYWPKEILSMLGYKKFPGCCRDSALSTLFSFQKIEFSFIDEKKKVLCEAIKEHLLGFGRNPSNRSYYSISPQIKNICENATPLLENQQQYFAKREKLFFKFKREWIANIPRLLPDDVAVIIQALPYLLASYVASASKNRIDPFDHDPVSGGYSGWLDIFRELNPKGFQQNQKEGGGNRSTSIRSLCNYFVIPSNRKPFAFYYDLDDQKNPIYAPRNVREKRRAKGKYIEPLSSSEAMEACFHCWEYYRQFACFCYICKDNPNVNITLSTALFASSWDLSSLCRSDCKNPICEKSRITTCAHPNFPDLLFPKYFCSIADIENDSFRKKILNALDLYGVNEPTIQTYTVNLWNEVALAPLSENDLEKFYQ